MGIGLSCQCLVRLAVSKERQHGTRRQARARGQFLPRLGSGIVENIAANARSGRAKRLATESLTVRNGGIRRKTKLLDQMNEGTGPSGHPEPRRVVLDQENGRAQKFAAINRSITNILIEILFGSAP